MPVTPSDRGPFDHIPSATGGAFPPRDGNLVEPLVDGGVAFDRIAAAVESAKSSVWVCVAFLEVGSRFPGGRGTFLDLMDGAARRGLDVRVLFWHPEGTPTGEDADDVFPGDESAAGVLAGRDTGWQARWDSAGRQCQHQKVWLVDAGMSDEVVFVGGINIGAGSMAGPDHAEAPEPWRYGNIHDVHCLVRGPVATDVHENFTMRWNGASERGREHGAWPPGGTDDLPPPGGRSAPAGGTRAQISRSVLPGLYDPLPDGENSVREQYLAAVGAARDYVYLENQVLLSRAVLEVLGEALGRGVRVVAMVPGDPMPVLAAARSHPGVAAGFDALAALGRREGFCLAAPAARRSWGYEEVYVHAKAAVVDDAWATIGSTNLIFTSFQGDTEMNVSFWDGDLVQGLRSRLVGEQGGFDSSGMSGVEAMDRLAGVARSNAGRREGGEVLQGFACAIDPATWAT